MVKPKVYIGLVHYPVYNKNMDVITTSITSLDIHDIARSARTYEVAGYYVIHPVESQQRLIREMLDFWQTGYGSTYNPDRKEAFSRIKMVNTIDEAMADIAGQEGQQPVRVTTDARIYPNTVTYTRLRQEVHNGDKPYLLLFGTGWGLEQETMCSAEYILEPIYGPGDYNHLCVRSAVSIILDRLLGEKWW
ncbi:MAG: RNA methyltransferase [Clostridia bacterium]|nr:RNA methyltransferase [Clostridia bacterium]